MKILAVDDDPVALIVLESALRSLGHEVVSAADGEQAWEALRDPTLRAVVCDWGLPRLDGLALCRRLRKEREDYVSFILLTQHAASSDNIDEAFAAGVDEFLTKPVNPHELRLRLHVAERIIGFTSQVRQLESFLPICSYCKKVRDDKKYWQEIETYVSTRAGTQFSHGVCPECYENIIVPQLTKLGISRPPADPQ